MKGISLSVSQLNEYVRKTLASDPMLRGLCLRGEISNLKRHISGHWYFTLKDEEAAVNCAMFRQAAQTVRFQPENGQQVRLFGSVGLYAKTGSYQFYADAMERDGLGELYLRFEALKERLASEGLFDPSIKKPLPLLPRGVGIVTSKTGAVVHDIARVAWRRNPGMQLYLCPVKVQGEGAADEIARAIRLLDAFSGADVIIAGRGGGSMEDLWAFNEEAVARAIAQCRTPVISAVGHETDFTIADFAADLRAPTPSAAAELAVPDKAALADAVSALEARMSRALESAFSAKRLRLNEMRRRLGENSPAQRGERMLASVAAAAARIDSLMESQLARRMHGIERMALRVKTSGPMDTLRRGYAVVTKNGRAVKSVDELSTGDALQVLMTGGSAQAAVTDIRKGEDSWLQRP